VDELVEAICTCERVPALPVVTANILALCNDPDVDFDKLAVAVSADPTLEAKFVQVANSALFSGGQKVETADTAIVRMGLKVTRLLVLGFTLEKEVRTRVTPEFDIERFWRHALTTGAGARAIARAVWPAARDDTLSVGLLQDIGMVAMECALPKEYAKVMEGRRRDRKAELPDLELRVFGLTHMEVGSELVRRWMFPSQIYLPILYHHRAKGDADLEKLPADVGNLTRIVRLGATVSRLFHGRDQSVAYKELTCAAIGEKHVETEQLEEILGSVETDVREICDLFGVQVRSIRTYEDIKAAIEQEQETETLQGSHA